MQREPFELLVPPSVGSSATKRFWTSSRDANRAWIQPRWRARFAIEDAASLAFCGGTASDGNAILVLRVPAARP
jgi:hypothetical protein